MFTRFHVVSTGGTHSCTEYIAILDCQYESQFQSSCSMNVPLNLPYLILPHDGEGPSTHEFSSRRISTVTESDFTLADVNT
jgi:hypothetical protein